MILRVSRRDPYIEVNKHEDTVGESNCSDPQ